jgi:hypothetical protein
VTDRVLLLALPFICAVLFLVALVTTIALGLEKPKRRDGLEPVNKRLMEFYKNQK